MPVDLNCHAIHAHTPQVRREPLSNSLRSCLPLCAQEEAAQRTTPAISRQDTRVCGPRRTQARRKRIPNQSMLGLREAYDTLFRVYESLLQWGRRRTERRYPSVYSKRGSLGHSLPMVELEFSRVLIRSWAWSISLWFVLSVQGEPRIRIRMLIRIGFV